MKILGFYISRTDWEFLYNYERECLLGTTSWACDLNSRLKKLQNKQSETYTDEQGKLRFRHNGQFAPYNRSKKKKTHDQLRTEVAYKNTTNWNELKNAVKK